ncbi:uncharacterized protein BKCO1_1300097 [Diplodia corticola]|uniref:Uncharacterized protein n=1 Tax=Diplodia corticola TaxID=236234 RepID=A0A1J9S878_9PEZI|nr:uncharacterized protein BKCO1_1300097 [Diplodia corticola]OJD36116.1 hypothetical protein BKCO1_1300097 [Diplodia corticola]
MLSLHSAFKSSGSLVGFCNRSALNQSQLTAPLPPTDRPLSSRATSFTNELYVPPDQATRAVLPLAAFGVTMSDRGRPSWLQFYKCGTLKDDYHRYVDFALQDGQAVKGSSLDSAIARFGTDCQCMSKNFALNKSRGKLGDFEPYASRGSDGERSFWRSLKFWGRKPDPLPTGTEPGTYYETSDGRRLNVLGLLKNTCWRGINLDEDIPGQLIKCPDNFIRDAPYNEFLVIDGLRADVVFGLSTTQFILGFKKAKKKNVKDQREIEKDTKREKREAEKKAAKEAATPKQNRVNRSTWASPLPSHHL